MTVVTQLKPMLMLGFIIVLGGALFFSGGVAYGLNADDIQDMKYAKEKAESLDMREELPNGQEIRVGGVHGGVTKYVMEVSMWEGTKWGANHPDVTAQDFITSFFVVVNGFSLLYLRRQWRSLGINDWPRRWVAG